MKQTILYLVFILTISCDSGASIGHPASMPVTSVVNNPLFVKAIQEGDQVAVEQMLPGISNLNVFFYVEKYKANFIPLQLAAGYGHRLLVMLFLDRGAEVDKKSAGSGRTALHVAVGKNHPQIVEELLRRGANVNALIDSLEDAGKTPLHLAVEKNSPYMVQRLIESGADVNTAKTIEDKGPLHIALEKNYVDIAKILLKKEGIAVNATTTEGETSLHLAAKNNGVSVAAILIDKGANVDAKTKEGQTPLHLAVENNCKEAVLCLLSNHANHQVANNQGRTPLALARSANHEGITKILEGLEKRTPRHACIAGAAECDKHCDGCPDCSCFGFKLNCGCFKEPCSFVCKTLCCAWSCCCPLPIEETAPPAPSSSNSTTVPNSMQQPLPGNATMQR